MRSFAAVPVDLASLARFILSSDCRSIALLSGAGISVASGIPDFRSPGGMYETLRPELLTATASQRAAMQADPTQVVSWELFSVNSLPYLEVRRPFILGTRQRQWKATIAHRFAELLQTMTDNKLTRVYTQNIDGLDRQCDEIPDDKIVNVHGTIAKAACEACGEEMDYDEFCRQVRTNIRDIYGDDDGVPSPQSSAPISCKKCGKPMVKPTTVLFGRNLPLEFFECAAQDLPTLDLLFIVGTSLVVSPANSLVYHVPESTVRVVVNVDPVGGFLGIDYSNNPNKRDLFLQGTTEQVFLSLIHELRWMEKLKTKMNDLPSQSVQLIQQLESKI